MAEETVEALKDAAIDTSEGAKPSEWEQRFETQINTFFDEAIGRIPGFADRHLKSFRRVMARSLGPRTGVGDVLIGARNLAAGLVRSVGGPDLTTTSYTEDQLRAAFEREVVSSDELESLLRRLFQEFEEAQWSEVVKKAAEQEAAREIDAIHLRERMVDQMEAEIGHDPLLAQAIRAGVRLGIPATLGYVLFGKMTFLNFGSEAATEIYKSRLNFFHRALGRLGGLEVPGWVGAVGLAGGLIGTLAIGGVMEFALNNVRDVKGAYIRQLNAARHNLLYGENPDKPEGQGILHVVRGLERQFERLPAAAEKVLEETETSS